MKRFIAILLCLFASTSVRAQIIPGGLFGVEQGSVLIKVLE